MSKIIQSSNQIMIMIVACQGVCQEEMVGGPRVWGSGNFQRHGDHHDHDKHRDQDVQADDDDDDKTSRSQ